MNSPQSKHRWLLLALPLLLATLAPSAYAGGDRHFGKHAYGHSARHSGHHRAFRHNYRHHNRYRYDRSYRHGYRHGYRHRHHHRRHSNRGAYLVGGIIAGSLITHALTRPQDRYTYNEYRTTRVISPAPVYRPASSGTSEVSRRLFRDRDGNCFERSQNSAGEELLIELPAESCAW